MQNKTAVVTGAGRGIGRRIATRLADTGVTVVLAGRAYDQLAEARAEIIDRGGMAAVAIADVTDEQQVADLVATAEATYGGVDVLVCNSGVGGPSVPLWELSRAEWDEAFAVNVTGVFLCCRAVAPSMIRQGSGSIVVIGSMTGKRPLVNRTPYAASKTALIGLVRTLAHELGPHGTRVNLVSPGAVAGERMEWVVRAQAEALGVGLDEARAHFTAESALGSFVDPDDVASAVTFLASDGASITGEDLNVSAGLTMY